MSALFGPRVAALFGVAFAVFLFLGVASLNVPSQATDQELTNWWSKSGNQDSARLSMGFVAISAIAFIVFTSYLRDRLNSGGGTSGNAMFGVALGAAAVLFATAAIRGTIANAITRDEPMPGVDTLRFFPELSYAFMEVAVIASGVAILLGSWAMKQTATFPAWPAWVGFVTGALTVVGGVFVGAFIIPIVLIWALAMSVAVWRNAPGAETLAGRAASAPA
jgi:hypothetical protein